MHKQMLRHADFVSSGDVNGILLDLGSYPGLIDQPNHDDSNVRGEIYRIKNEAALFSLLDPYEGYSENDTESSHYIRVKRQVFRDDAAGELACWVYLFNLDPKPYIQIGSGDYCA
jgi:gamma-glutamylcyclotransferase (GGCT)/AIG2-like uncharacterized protein YtfP